MNTLEFGRSGGLPKYRNSKDSFGRSGDFRRMEKTKFRSASRVGLPSSEERKKPRFVSSGRLLENENPKIKICSGGLLKNENQRFGWASEKQKPKGKDSCGGLPKNENPKIKIHLGELQKNENPKVKIRKYSRRAGCGRCNHHPPPGLRPVKVPIWPLRGKREENKRESEECGGCGGCGGYFKNIGRGIPPEKSFDFTPPDPSHPEHLPHVQDSVRSSV
ncbi:hypothetical protein GLOIN_2v1779851 [Rhizophagus irregularis DAOM 181602=DAOM 197198]|nr:hypothetical protein GLOIN_2v1779851 [Rhizophagus irregularis DAOM 181602=DAOM 197198]